MPGRANGTVSVHRLLGLVQAGFYSFFHFYSFVPLTWISSFWARSRSGLSLLASPGTSIRPFGVRYSFQGCTVPIARCLPHGEGEPQLFPISCTEWQQWRAQMTLLGSKIEDEGRGKTQPKNITCPSSHQFLSECERIMKKYEMAELK